MGRIIAGFVCGWLLAAPATLQADEHSGPDWMPGVAVNLVTGPHPWAAAPANEGSEAAEPSWGGFIGTLDRQVRLTLERASELRRHSAITRPPHGGPGGGGPGGGDGPPAGQDDPGSTQGATSPTRLWFGPVSPNPSSGQVTFRVELPVAGMVRISILDIAGRLVGEIREPRGAGRHTLTWSPRDHAGPAGVYLARLDVDGRPIGVRRLVVLR